MSSSIDSQHRKASPPGDFLKKSNGIDFTISAPGKVILHGEHSVVYGKLALAASLGLRTSATLKETIISEGIPVIEVHFPDINLRHSFNFEEIQSLLNESLPTREDISRFNVERPEVLDHDLHLRKIKEFLSRNCDYNALSRVQINSLTSFLYLFTAIFSSLNVNVHPFHLSVSSQLFIGAGTGSSASFVVCLVASFIHYFKLLTKQSNESGKLSRYGYAPTFLTLNSDTTTFDQDELNIISNWGFYGEKIHHGNPSGIDNTICTYGSLLAFTKGSPLVRKTISYPLKLLLINTKVPRDTKTLVLKVADFLEKFPEVVNGILNTMDEISKTALKYLDNLNSSSLSKEQTTETLKKLEDLSEINHSLLGVLGVSHPALEKIMTILRKYDLKGKLTGAGGGGYATSLVPPCFSSIDLDRVLTDLINEGFNANVTTLGEEGVRVDN